MLEREGFRFFSLHQERIWPFSVVLLLPVYVMMAKNEHVRVETPLRITSYHLMYVSEDGGTFAYLFGLGCKFYTRFVDDTWVVSNTAQSIQDEKVVVLKREAEPVTTGQLWQKHRMKLQEYQEQGRQLAARVTFEDWVEIESRFDQGSVNSVIGLGIGWMIFLIWVIYWVVSTGSSILDILF